VQNKKAAAPSLLKAQPPDCSSLVWNEMFLQRGLDVVMSGAVTNNCFHQGNGPQNDLTQDLGRLDIHRIHAVDAEQNQTSNAATQNVIVHKSNLLYFSHRLTPEAQVSAGRFPLSAFLLYRSFDIKSISKNVKQIKVSFESRFVHVNKAVKFALLYKCEVSVLNWP
jgi:hypothetical protein